MKEKASEENLKKTDSSDGLYKFKVFWRLAALINLGSMPMGTAAGPLLLWLMENDRGQASEEGKSRSR
jgi:hypothetical protein